MRQALRRHLLNFAQQIASEKPIPTNHWLRFRKHDLRKQTWETSPSWMHFVSRRQSQQYSSATIDFCEPTNVYNTAIGFSWRNKSQSWDVSEIFQHVYECTVAQCVRRECIVADQTLVSISATRLHSREAEAQDIKRSCTRRTAWVVTAYVQPKPSASVVFCLCAARRKGVLRSRN